MYIIKNIEKRFYITSSPEIFTVKEKLNARINMLWI